MNREELLMLCPYAENHDVIGYLFNKHNGNIKSHLSCRPIPENCVWISPENKHIENGNVVDFDWEKFRTEYLAHRRLNEPDNL